jgi:glycosyltransferase involved in cell wall biosynthesis
MRILYFHQHFSTPTGVGGTRSYEFARALVAHGHSVTMVCGSPSVAKLNLPYDSVRGWSRGRVHGIDVIALPLKYSNSDGLSKRALTFAKFGWRSLRIALHEQADLVFATSTPLTAGVPGIAMKLLGRRVPFVFEVRDLWPELPRALGLKNPILLGAMSLLEWASYRSCDAAVGLSPGIVAGIRRRSKADLPVTMVPNGCDLNLFHPRERTTLALAGIRPGDFVAGFTGAHGPANGLDAVLDAAAALKRRGDAHVKFVLIGDGKEKNRLEARAATEGLDNCLFLPPVPKKDIARITASFDCGLMILKNVPAFYYGTSPNKFFDYISSGIPVVINYPGWLADMIDENCCGVAVPPADAEALADTLYRLASLSESERCEIGARGRELAAREFSREALSDLFVRTLENVAKAYRS